MWVKTKEGDALYHVAGIRVKRLVSERCFALEGLVSGQNADVTLGEYQTWEEAYEKLEAFEAFLNEGNGNLFTL